MGSYENFRACCMMDPTRACWRLCACRRGGEQTGSHRRLSRRHCRQLHVVTSREMPSVCMVPDYSTYLRIYLPCISVLLPLIVNSFG